MPAVLKRAFYCVADARYFVGVVAMVNSLRLVGQRESIVVLDCGLKPAQRALLEHEAIVLAPSRELSPMRAKVHGPLQLPAAELVVVIDADVVAVRPLASLLERAASGNVVAFADDQPERARPEWRSVVSGAGANVHPYINTGFLALPGDLAPSLLKRAGDAQDHVARRRGPGFGDGSAEDPFRHPDQDALNPVLAATVPAARMTILDHGLAPFQPWEKVELEDALSLRCRVADGEQPYLLHHIDHKPWLKPMPSSVYTTLLPRLLSAADLPLRIDPGELPLRLRSRRRLGPWRWTSAKTAGVRVMIEGWQSPA